MAKGKDDGAKEPAARNSKDTSRTKTGADFHYPSAKGKLSPAVKAYVITDPLKEGLMVQHRSAMSHAVPRACAHRP